MRVDIFLNKTVDQNAALYYEKAKKAKKKLKGTIETIARFEKQLSEQENVIEEKQEVQQKKARKQQWFEKFRWFLSSSGLLVIGGRDATTNEMIIKKYTDKNDLVFHTDMAGSPFFVVKSEGKTIDEKTKLEVADATCSFSRAWKLNLSTTSVFFVSPDQVTKEANSGEYLTKGSFVIRGKTNYIDNKINLAVGKIKDGEYKDMIICAPLEAVKASCDVFVRIKQGDSKSSDIAKMLRKILGAESVDEILRILPPGNISLVKERK
jgi:predicted ribosome quality control (RQC) complex YloA/Tae2 family protein